MFALAKQLSSYNDVRLSVATVYIGKEIKSFDIDGILYYLLPVKSFRKYQKSLEQYWQKVCRDYNPDIIHIHGTEYAHGLACMRILPAYKYVISIQGLVSIYARYYYAGINPCKIINHLTFRDLIRHDTIFHGKRKYELKGIFEKEYFLRSKHVIGRTSWDYAQSKALNPFITYHFCNESLRDSYYTELGWNISEKTCYSIFISQSEYPIKGMHQVLIAMSILKVDFPEIKLRVAGPDILKDNSLMEKIKLSGYGNYINSLIKKYKLNNNVVFTGILDEEHMVTEYKQAHLFICPSSIENSPNSLGEAQLIGVPCVAAYVGGIPDMISHGKSGLLYRFEEIEMLAYNIKRIFEDDCLAMRLSRGGKIAATERHDREKNSEKTISIYKKIIGKH